MFMLSSKWFFFFINALLANFFTRERLLFENFPTFGCRTHNLVLSNTQRRGIKKQFKPKKPFENFPPNSFLLLISTKTNGKETPALCRKETTRTVQDRNPRTAHDIQIKIIYGAKFISQKLFPVPPWNFGTKSQQKVFSKDCCSPDSE